MWGNKNYHSVLISIKIGSVEGRLAQSNKINDRITYNPGTILLEKFLYNVLMQIYTRMLIAALFLTEKNYKQLKNYQQRRDKL